MRIFVVFLSALVLATNVSADRLTSADREALLDNLEKLRETVDSRVDSRFKLAIGAYREAVASDEAAIAFYLKCVEKLDYTDQNRKPSEFRAWKKSKSDMLSDSGFRSALRCQLQWLILTLRASSSKADIKSLAPEAQSILDGIFINAEKLRAHRQVLNQPVTSTVFARIYEIGSPEGKQWPQSPVQIDAIYDQVIFPTVSGPGNLDKLRASWINRIRLEQTRFDKWQMNPRANGKGNAPDDGVDARKFIDEILPELQWQMEMDLFKNGDEAGAAKRMLVHISEHIDHESSRNWGEQFKNLLAPAQQSAEEEKSADSL